MLILIFTGYYKYCLTPSFYCPSCVRQVYLNLFNKSICLASFGKAQLDCQEKHFSQPFTAPNSGGTYEIKVILAEYNMTPLTCKGNKKKKKAIGVIKNIQVELGDK